MRTPALARANPGRRRSSIKSTVPAIGGWNARDPITSMRENEAVELINWFPQTANLVTRPGCIAWATGLPSVAKTLMSYSSPATKKQFAATDTGIYDVTGSGAVGAAVTTVTNGIMSWTNATSLGGQYLVAVNGVDKLQLYNGTTWTAVDNLSTPSITGLATTSLTEVTTHNRRLWFAQASSMSAWYLPVNVVGGALTEFPLGQLFRRGGQLYSIFTWTVDNGTGPNDYLCFLTSEGELAIFYGNDPATNWFLTGVFYVGIPVGPKATVKYGGDVLIITKDGGVPLGKVLQSTTVNRAIAFTDKIAQAITDATTTYGANRGWQCLLYLTGNLVIVNVPTAEFVSATQYVMNTITGAWTRFTGWNAVSWVQHNGDLYFSSGTGTYKAWVGTSDNGAAIVATVRTAYNYFNTRGAKKRCNLVRFLFQYLQPFPVQIQISSDFGDYAASSSVTYGSASSALWGTGVWGTATWGSPSTDTTSWATVYHPPGYALSLKFTVQSSTTSVTWNGVDYAFETGVSL